VALAHPRLLPHTLIVPLRCGPLVDRFSITADNRANLAFGLYPPWRGHGLATRAVLLAVCFLVRHPQIEEALIRVDPRNSASAAVARRAHFRHIGKVNKSDNYEWFVRDIR
jgi:RimJ/RimL family protein N-acetyltransferase